MLKIILCSLGQSVQLCQCKAENCPKQMVFIGYSNFILKNLLKKKHIKILQTLKMGALPKLKNLSYRGLYSDSYYFEDSAGNEVDLILQKTNDRVGLIIKAIKN